MLADSKFAAALLFDIMSAVDIFFTPLASSKEQPAKRTDHATAVATLARTLPLARRFDEIMLDEMMTTFVKITPLSIAARWCI